MVGSSGRAVKGAGLTLAMLLVLNGCASHRKVKPLILPPFTPVALAELPEPAEPPMVEGDDDDDLPPVPVAEGVTVPRRQRKRAARPVAPAAVPDAAPPQVASTAPPTESAAASVLGELTPGGDQDPKTQQEAAELIAANERRLNALPAELARSQAALVSNVRNFQKQAQQALKSGDAAGAKTLATKGKLLLDDLDKAAAGG